MKITLVNNYNARASSRGNGANIWAWFTEELTPPKPSKNGGGGGVAGELEKLTWSELTGDDQAKPSSLEVVLFLNPSPEAPDARRVNVTKGSCSGVNVLGVLRDKFHDKVSVSMYIKPTSRDRDTGGKYIVSARGMKIDGQETVFCWGGSDSKQLPFDFDDTFHIKVIANICDGEDEKTILDYFKNPQKLQGRVDIRPMEIPPRGDKMSVIDLQKYIVEKLKLQSEPSKPTPKVDVDGKMAVEVASSSSAKRKRDSEETAFQIPKIPKRSGTSA